MPPTLEILAEITEEEVGLKPSKPSSYTLRKASRAVVSGPGGKVALMYSPRDRSYELPGGGIEDGENAEEALRREALEESGYRIRINRCVGVNMEYRNASRLLKISYCFLAHTVGRPKKPRLDRFEVAAGLMLMWVENIDDAINRIGRNPNNGPGERFSNKSDMTFLKKARDILKQEQA
jgi:ADP-ribose pyrophosphatase YjhB (NUDIX family)